MIYPRPSFDDALDTLGKFAATEEEHDLREAVEHVVGVHWSEAEEPEWPDDKLAPWGRCKCCDTEWPCPIWGETELVVMEWLIGRSTEATRGVADPKPLGELLPGVVAGLAAAREARRSAPDIPGQRDPKPEVKR